MKKKILVLAAVVTLIVGVFTISMQNKSLTVNQAYGYGVVICYWSKQHYCIIDGETFLDYYPVSVTKPTEPTIK